VVCIAAPILDAYYPDKVESGWYSLWEERGYFKGGVKVVGDDPLRDASPPPTFSMLLPPPNVTGALHIGHALTISIQDSLVRYYRMRGYDTIWIPGLDHAGIATQVVVEKKLMKDEGKSRHDVGRERFLEYVFEWYHKYGKQINLQLKRLGASLDWSQEFFTLDLPRSHAVREAFIQLYNNDCIYRDNRIVNWCPVLNTAISDIELDHMEVTKATTIKVPGRSKPVTVGTISTFAYPIEGDEGGEICVSTTRLETMIGDVGKL
jgi:valyl-tRNA synthetase